MRAGTPDESMSLPARVLNVFAIAHSGARPAGGVRAREGPAPRDHVAERATRATRTRCGDAGPGAPVRFAAGANARHDDDRLRGHPVPRVGGGPVRHGPGQGRGRTPGRRPAAGGRRRRPTTAGRCRTRRGRVHPRGRAADGGVADNGRPSPGRSCGSRPETRAARRRIATGRAGRGPGGPASSRVRRGVPRPARDDPRRRRPFCQVARGSSCTPRASSCSPRAGRGGGRVLAGRRRRSAPPGRRDAGAHRRPATTRCRA